MPINYSDWVKDIVGDNDNDNEHNETDYISNNGW